MRFHNKTVVVTGAASGIGRATALLFAAEGAKVYAADIDEAGLAQTAAESNGEVHTVRCDVCNTEDIKALMDRAAAETGGIDAVFNNAGAGVGTETSIYLVVWGENTVFCPFPKGSKAGLMHQDLGEESVPDASNNFYQALRTLYTWENGLVVKDWRYVVRVCNVNVTDLTTLTGTQALTTRKGDHGTVVGAELGSRVVGLGA